MIKRKAKFHHIKLLQILQIKFGYLFDTQYVDTSNRIDFISSQTMNAMDIIDYCLRMGVSEKDPPSYFLTRILDSTRYVI